MMATFPLVSGILTILIIASHEAEAFASHHRLDAAAQSLCFRVPPWDRLAVMRPVNGCPVRQSKRRRRSLGGSAVIVVPDGGNTIRRTAYRVASQRGNRREFLFEILKGFEALRLPSRPAKPKQILLGIDCCEAGPFKEFRQLVKLGAEPFVPGDDIARIRLPKRSSRTPIGVDVIES